jgi:alanine racemase
MTPVAHGGDVELARSRTWATVDLDAVGRNIAAIRAILPAQTLFMAVVKADAYGHGAVEVARASVAAGAGWLGVATAEEALELRSAGLDAPVLIMGPVPEGLLSVLVDAGCALTLADESTLAALRRRAGRRARVHLKVDTGMTRLGVAPDAVERVVAALDSERIAVEGVFTHLACADDPDPTVTREQLALFAQCAQIVRSRWPGAIRHVAASAAALADPTAAMDMVRIGLALYGVSPARHLVRPTLRPAMTLSSRVARVRRVAPGTPVSYGATYRTPRETCVATVAIGYADGYPRALSGTGQMLVGGRRFPVVGRVCMDYTMLDVGDAAVREGDLVTVFGADPPAAAVAEAAGTIAYELFCRVGRRVPRIYLRGGRPVAVRAAGASRAHAVGAAAAVVDPGGSR